MNPRSIRVHLAAIRSFQVMKLGFDPCLHTPRVNLIMKGLERNAPSPKRPEPFTYSMLHALYPLLFDTLDYRMLWAAITLAFFAGLRVSELCGDMDDYPIPTIPSIQVLNQYYIYNVIRSKNCIKGFQVCLPCVGSQPCPYCSMVTRLSQIQSISLSFQVARS